SLWAISIPLVKSGSPVAAGPSRSATTIGDLLLLPLVLLLPALPPPPLLLLLLLLPHAARQIAATMQAASDRAARLTRGRPNGDALFTPLSSPCGLAPPGCISFAPSEPSSSR